MAFANSLASDSFFCSSALSFSKLSFILVLQNKIIFIFNWDVITHNMYELLCVEFIVLKQL